MSAQRPSPTCGTCFGPWSTVQRPPPMKNMRGKSEQPEHADVFTSLKRIAEQDWEAWFERVSDVVRILAQSDVYRGLDDASRTSYRNAVEDRATRRKGRARHCAPCALRWFRWRPRRSPDRVTARGAPASDRLSHTGQSPRRDLLRGQGAAGYVAAMAMVTLVIVVIGTKVIGAAALGTSTILMLLLMLAARPSTRRWP